VARKLAHLLAPWVQAARGDGRLPAVVEDEPQLRDLGRRAFGHLDLVVADDKVVRQARVCHRAQSP
jgi:hypothetical protein